MKLIVGLGNPGKEYENTRHSFGSMAVLAFYKKHADVFGAWKEKFNARLAIGKLEGEKLALALPQTFMNNSGMAVQALIKNLKLGGKIDNLWVIHDDLDLPLGLTRLSFGATSAGHKGVESIIKSLKSKDFIRFRLGIKPARGLGKKSVDNFVLEKFTKSEMAKVSETLEKTVSAMESALDIGIGRVMNEYNR